MVEAVREGTSQRRVARDFGVARSTLQWWLKRAADRRLDDVDWATLPPVAHRIPGRTRPETETAVLTCRRQLKETSALGFYGAAAIHEALEGTRIDLPSIRTIGRILERNGVLDGRRRVRRAAPPPGWYLPDVAHGNSELESFDVIEGLVIEGRGEINVLTGRALWGPHTAAWPMLRVTAKSLTGKLLEHWRANGLPAYAQFDNDTRFCGPQNHSDVVGRVARLCLSLGVTPVFAPPRETGFQAAIESFNNVWQAKVWARFHHVDLAMLERVSGRFLRAYVQRLARRGERVPRRRPFPQNWQLNLQAEPAGRLVYLRRTNASGVVVILGREFDVDPLWAHRLLRCEVHIREHEIRCYRLRRREPDAQPLVKKIDYRLPKRRFKE